MKRDFRNEWQEALGLPEITAAQFLKNESASGLAFGIAAASADRSDLAAEYDSLQAAAAAVDPVDFEEAVVSFLRSIWVDGTDPDDAISTIATAYLLAGLGKAADAIERRLGCVWGSSSPNLSAMMAWLGED